MRRYLRSSTEAAAKEAAPLLSRKTKQIWKTPGSKHVKARIPEHSHLRRRVSQAAAAGQSPMPSWQTQGKGFRV
jgi:hypothetical protein